jgi:hypothetical protein
MSDVLAWFTTEHMLWVLGLCTAVSNFVPPHTIAGKALHFLSGQIMNIWHLPGSGGPGTVAK